MISTKIPLAKNYEIGAYIRLSREDEKLGESESIINQKKFLKNWINEHNYILKKIYIDDGVSGTSFDRPAFNQMIKDIEQKKINMVITKDMSRLGRDYIKTGEYIEKYFPDNNIRYVAITDGIDTAFDSSNNDIAPFKAVFNDMYAKDISKKIKTAIRTKQKEGLWVGGTAPFGYMSESKNKNLLVPNPKEAYIVKQIFLLAKRGKNLNEIKDLLIEKQIPTPSMVRKEDKRLNHSTLSKNGIWSIRTIKTILTNRIYTGDMVQNKTSKTSYKLKKTRYNPQEEWIVVKNTHEALISKEDFDMIQKLLPKNSFRTTKKSKRLLDGLLYCYECNHKIGICPPRKNDNKTYIVCNYYKTNSKYNVCTSHNFNYDCLEKVILNEIKQIFLKYIEENKLKKYILKAKILSEKKDINKELEELNSKIEKLNENIDIIYTDKLEGKISSDMFDRFYKKYNESLIKLINEKEKLKNYKPQNKNYDLLLKKFIKFENPNREIMTKLIDKIYIHNNKQIDIYFNFKISS